MNAVLRRAQTSDFENLMRFYVQFEPKADFHGLPPLTTLEIEEWLHRLEGSGYHNFVMEVGVRIIGHSILELSKAAPEAELVMFVHQDFRGLGLGRRLLVGVLNHACRELHLDRVWTMIPSADPTIQEELERLGFHVRDLNEVFNGEFEMERSSNCPECKEERCLIFRQSLPATVAVPKTYW